MWIPEVTTTERIVRAAVGYVFLLVAFRLMGKRQVGQLTPFDLVVLLIIGSVLQNAMIGPDAVFLESTGRMTAGSKAR